MLEVKFPNSSDSSLFSKCLRELALGLIETDETPLEAKERKEENSTLVTFDDLYIRTKDKRLIQFNPNHVQAKYLDEIAPEWRSGHYYLASLREILLKARQFGFSTLIAALFFCDTINNPNTRTVVLAHDLDTSKLLFNMVQTFYDCLPPHKKRPTEYSNRRELVFEDTKSAYYVGTAGSLSFGRGGTINNVHGSEVAFWPDAEVLLTGLLEAVPDDGNVFLETTANGLGNFYHEEFTLAQNGGSIFKPRFFAWFEHEEYATEPPAGFTLTEDEQKLKSTHNLSDAQINWYRKKAKSLKRKVAQEYPSTAEEAFVASGNPYFDRDRLKEILHGLITNPELQHLDVRFPDTYRLLNKYRDRIELFKLPADGEDFLIGADVAEGLDADGKHDFDSAHVLNWNTWEEYCHLHGSWEPNEYGQILAELGHFFNEALIVVERNNHGHSTLNTLINSVQYGNVYFHEEYDEYKKETTKKPGWPTTVKTKFIALDTLNAAIDENGIHLRSRKTIGEMMTFVKKPGGKAGGEGSSHDDRVISVAIASAVALTQKPARYIEVSW